MVLESTDLQTYKNRWLTMAKGRIAGVGMSSAQAYHAGKAAYPKDRQQLLYVDENGVPHPQPQSFAPWFDHPLLAGVTHWFTEQQITAYLVGGAVRDGLRLGRLKPGEDLDLVTASQALATARRLADDMHAAFYPMDEARDVARVIFRDGTYIDLTSFRGATLLEDLQGRDFTINAITLILNDQDPWLYDPLGGQADLKAAELRLADPDAIANDPLRGVRAVRQALQFNFSIIPATQLAIKANAAALSQISPERLREELVKLLLVDTPGTAIQMLLDLDLLPGTFAAVRAMVGVSQSAPHHLDVFHHTLSVMNYWPKITTWQHPQLAPLIPFKAQLQAYFDTKLAGNLSRRTLMPWLGLLHDIGKPATFQRDKTGRIRFFGHPQVGAKMARQMLSNYRFSKQAIDFVVSGVEHHMRPLFLANQPTVSQKAIFRLTEAAGEATPAVAIFAITDHLATYAPDVNDHAELEALVAVAVRLCRHYFSPPLKLLLNGKMIMTHLNLPPGPQIGQILRQLKEAQVVGTVKDRESALRFVEKIGRVGLK